ncbi:MAG: acetyltransferase, ribosomal protein N-acetylase [Bacteroidota bacterium]|jgi:ribosomal-protein-alanine N-acetyltransferase|nr:acetyltransferase, ribosomal protein N-acetylase [Bacteroidota bacterium]
MLKLNFDPFPVIKTDRLVLRRMTLQDLDHYYALRTNVVAMKHIDQKMPTLDETIEKIQKVNEMINMNDGIAWAVCLNSDNIMIGTASYHRVIKEHHRAEIGYILNPDFWKKGIISEALEKVIDYGFKTMNLHTIEAQIDPENLASQKVLEKFKFVREAYYKENFLVNGQFQDTAVYSLICPKS